MSDYVSTSIGHIKIVGAFFEEDMQIVGNPRAWSEDRLEALLASLYEAMRKHGVEGHISIVYNKSIGTKVNT